MHVALTLSVASILTAAVLLWLAVALIRAYFRRQRRIKRELKEMKRLERNEKIAARFQSIKGIVKR